MKQGLLYFTDTYLTIIGLMIFFGFFLTALVWVFLPRNRNLYKYTAQLPLVAEDTYE
jgi:cytochrome c oxidase cbb3-type subunit 4